MRIKGVNENIAKKGIEEVGHTFRNGQDNKTKRKISDNETKVKFRQSDNAKEEKIHVSDNETSVSMHKAKTARMETVINGVATVVGAASTVYDSFVKMQEIDDRKEQTKNKKEEMENRHLEKMTEMGNRHKSKMMEIENAQRNWLENRAKRYMEIEERQKELRATKENLLKTPMNEWSEVMLQEYRNIEKELAGIAKDFINMKPDD